MGQSKHVVVGGATWTSLTDSDQLRVLVGPMCGYRVDWAYQLDRGFLSVDGALQVQPGWA